MMMTMMMMMIHTEIDDTEKLICICDWAAGKDHFLDRRR